YLYGEKLKVEFISKIRDERKFDSLDKLRKAITADTRKARSILQPDNEK
ncbi:MAG: riboflavin kinase, partial [Paramuribaculum sp.]|nr:riboflavin kinase [Paramuribaculum sp.]